MQKAKRDLNTIYISERVQECLRRISRCPLTAVVAPMGYGKTTAVNWYLAARTKAENAVVVRVSIYADNLSIFWRSVQSSFANAGLDILSEYECPNDKGSAAMAADALCYAMEGDTPYYIFLDDFHLLDDGRVAEFICFLANRLPENVHLIVASRDRFLPGGEIMRLGGRLHRIDAQQLRLNHTEISAYARKCGVELTDEQTDALLRSSEGWFSAIYLNLRSVMESGELLGGNSDIYEMFTFAMIDPLDGREREFLAAMSLADEFTTELAGSITGYSDVKRILQSLTEQNAFVTRLQDGRTYRFHHMLKECAGRIFQRMDAAKQRVYRDRYGRWYAENGMYIHALYAFRQSGDFDAWLRVVESDAGVMLPALKAEELLPALEQCPVERLKDHPLAILVLMRRMFTLRQIPKMLELKALLEASVSGHSEYSPEEKGNLLGECDLIMSFIMYNDISQMSRLHRSASRQMTHPAVSLRSSGSWTFGSPSVLMMFHRAPGGLDSELAEMNDCMPHYYKITNGHGLGAELVMSAEAMFCRGRLDEAAIALERAYSEISGCGQRNMALCCDFLALRLSLCRGGPAHDPGPKRLELLRAHDSVMLNLLDSVEACFYALLGLPERAPVVFREHQLQSVSYMAPGKPMMELIEAQVYLAQGEYARVIGRSEMLLKVCAGMNYSLVSLHALIQTAAAYEMLGKRAEARKYLLDAVELARPDGLVMPFAENWRYISAAMDKSWDEVLFDKVSELGTAYEASCFALRAPLSRPEAAWELSDRELEIAKMAAARLSNKEIAGKLFLSEGTVKQYVNQIYSKLHIEGDTRIKRRLLAELMNN